MRGENTLPPVDVTWRKEYDWKRPVSCLKSTETRVQCLFNNPLLSCNHVHPAWWKWAKDNPWDLRKHASLFCLNLVDFGRGQPLPGSSPRCRIKVRSSWCWQCADDKPGLKEKCWGPREPNAPVIAALLSHQGSAVHEKRKSKKKKKKKTSPVAFGVTNMLKHRVNLTDGQSANYAIQSPPSCLPCTHIRNKKKSSQHFIRLLIKWQEISTLKKTNPSLKHPNAFAFSSPFSQTLPPCTKTELSRLFFFF